ncbi:unnamed protein product [Prorocentrum cordatum]|uniref:F5/8 type C domain-containing protein n=1 Tax=Prorocentrum cordatum TaxID=2364126 RepID=A0ABN9WZ07_9DINO|nr:unnamed protein product [Polarella glacialis]
MAAPGLSWRWRASGLAFIFFLARLEEAACSTIGGQVRSTVSPGYASAHGASRWTVTAAGQLLEEGVADNRMPNASALATFAEELLVEPGTDAPAESRAVDQRQEGLQEDEAKDPADSRMPSASELWERAEEAAEEAGASGAAEGDIAVEQSGSEDPVDSRMPSSSELGERAEEAPVESGTSLAAESQAAHSAQDEVEDLADSRTPNASELWERPEIMVESDADAEAASASSGPCTASGSSTNNKPENTRTYSSVWGNQAAGTGHARSALDSVQAWSSRYNSVGQWMQMDLGASVTVSGVVTQGRANWNQWVTSYEVATSLDGKHWKDISGRFAGNSDRSTKVKAMLPSPQLARYIRIKPQAWHGHMSMRAAALTCSAPPTGKSVAVGAAAGADPSSSAVSCSASSGVWDNQPENTRTYSSVWGNQAAGTGHARSALDSVQAWSSRYNSVGQWMQMDLGAAMSVRGVVTQGRANWNQWVTKYQVATSLDGTHWQTIGGTYTGNRDRSSKVKGMFAASELARYVRIKPQKWHGHMSMRAGVLTCAAPVKAASVSCDASSSIWVNEPENKRAYSSVWGNNKVGTGHARSTLDSYQAWSSRYNSIGQWMQMDLGAAKSVRAIVTQGRFRSGQWVTSYQVSVSDDGKSWQDFGDTFTGNRDRDTKVQGILPSCVSARYVRIKPLDWYRHMSMRAGVLTCAGPVKAAARSASGASCDATSSIWVNEPENKRAYSSVWGNNKVGTGHAQSTLDSYQAWSSRYNSIGQWMQMDLGATKTVRGVVTQGRWRSSQWVTSYQVSVSEDGRSWHDIGATFTGNKDLVARHWRHFHGQQGPRHEGAGHSPVLCVGALCPHQAPGLAQSHVDESRSAHLRRPSQGCCKKCEWRFVRCEQ